MPKSDPPSRLHSRPDGIALYNFTIANHDVTSNFSAPALAVLSDAVNDAVHKVAMNFRLQRQLAASSRGAVDVDEEFANAAVRTRDRNLTSPSSTVTSWFKQPLHAKRAADTHRLHEVLAAPVDVCHSHLNWMVVGESQAVTLADRLAARVATGEPYLPSELKQTYRCVRDAIRVTAEQRTFDSWITLSVPRGQDRNTTSPGAAVSGGAEVPRRPRFCFGGLSPISIGFDNRARPIVLEFPALFAQRLQLDHPPLDSTVGADGSQDARDEQDGASSPTGDERERGVSSPEPASAGAASLLFDSDVWGLHRAPYFSPQMAAAAMASSHDDGVVQPPSAAAAARMRTQAAHPAADVWSLGTLLLRQALCGVDLSSYDLDGAAIIDAAFDNLLAPIQSTSWGLERSPTMGQRLAWRYCLLREMGAMLRTWSEAEDDGSDHTPDAPPLTAEMTSAESIRRVAAALANSVIDRFGAANGTEWEEPDADLNLGPRAGHVLGIIGKALLWHPSDRWRAFAQLCSFDDSVLDVDAPLGGGGAATEDPAEAALRLVEDRGLQLHALLGVGTRADVPTGMPEAAAAFSRWRLHIERDAVVDNTNAGAREVKHLAVFGRLHRFLVSRAAADRAKGKPFAEIHVALAGAASTPLLGTVADIMTPSAPSRLELLGSMSAQVAQHVFRFLSSDVIDSWMVKTITKEGIPRALKLDALDSVLGDSGGRRTRRRHGNGAATPRSPATPSVNGSRVRGVITAAEFDASTLAEDLKVIRSAMMRHDLGHTDTKACNKSPGMPASDSPFFGSHGNDPGEAMTTSLRRRRSDVMAAIVTRDGRVPPTLRADVWGVLLGVGPARDRHDRFYNVDRYRATNSDRQIAVDIPRCHQYNQVLSSTDGHEKLLRVLKAWVVTNPDKIYWQGIDSVCAVLLSIAFNDEPLVFACLERIVAFYVPHFFSTSTMDHRVVLFTHWLKYVDPQLGAHFDTLGIKAEQFAISWFLTLFAHNLPLRKVYPLWDALFLSGSPTFAVALAIAVVQQHRDELLSLDFSAAVQLLSSTATLHNMDVTSVVARSRAIFAQLPQSIAVPDMTDAKSALVKTSECSMIHPVELARALDAWRATHGDSAILEVGSTASSKGLERWAHGLVLIDTRPVTELVPSLASGDGDGWDDEFSPYAGGRGVVEAWIKAGEEAADSEGTNDKKSKSHRRKPIVPGAIHLPFDGVSGWDTSVVLGRLKDPRSMLIPPAAKPSELGFMPTGAAATDVAPAPGQPSPQSAPHVVLLAGAEPESGQSAATALIKLGVPHVSCVLGGIDGIRRNDGSSSLLLY